MSSHQFLLFVCDTNPFSYCSIMEGEEGLKRFSPEVILKDSRFRHAASLLPQIILFHGMDDYSIPCDARLISVVLLAMW